MSPTHGIIPFSSRNPDLSPSGQNTDTGLDTFNGGVMRTGRPFPGLWVGVGWGSRGGWPRRVASLPHSRALGPWNRTLLCPSRPQHSRLCIQEPVIEEKTHTHTGASKSTHSNTGCREICHLFTCEQTHGHLWQCLLATAREAHMCKASHAVNTDTNAPVCMENCSAWPW